MAGLEGFSAATQAWFRAAFAAPTAAQTGAWAAIERGSHTLVVAPTGSGKTLAAFLAALDRLVTTPPPADRQLRCRVLYVSPLKALAVDVERNLRAPLTGIAHASARLGVAHPDITVAIRSGDTPATERRAIATKPPDILITTPESLFLLLTSQAREALRGVETVIIDEVHAVLATKRGAHLALSLERLDALLERPAQRIGLSATVRPIEEVSRFLGGGREVVVVAPPSAKTMEISVVVPVPDLTDLSPVTDSVGEPSTGGSSTGGFDPGQQGPDPRASIWPATEAAILDLVEAHRSTIVFVNSRRIAERLTARLNELSSLRAQQPLPASAVPAEAIGASGASRGALPEVARAHHGSVSREQRALTEEALKEGRLPAVVATSSLELGIDMGAVDLVVQVEAPPSVASGLQRVGRAGHQVGAISKGVLFPKFRGDLLSCAVVAERMAAGAIESMHYPRNPLDVLAQQIVAMVAIEAWQVDELAAVIRRAAPYAGLPQSALEATLDMLAGRYPSDDFAELRPRITWDRVTGILTARPGAQRLAVTSGGTIPDRGLFGVFLVGEKSSRVGELDEEMVYESRVGDVFLLGSSSWRIEDITPDRVLVTPAPGQPGRMPFWKGDAAGRPYELGQALGAFVRDLGTATEAVAKTRCQKAGLDPWAIDNLLAYVHEQRQATGVVPDDRTVLIERFRDELGDWRVAIHSPFGAQVNGPWSLAVAARFRERYGMEVAALHSDDGIVLRLPDMDEAPDLSLVILEAEDVDQLVQAELGGSALFASRFRECSARSLLLPRRTPGRRTPLWQQRMRSAALLEVAARYPTFPVVLEAMRECLQDVYDVPALTSLMRDIANRSIRVIDVETAAPSPFTRSLLFGYVGTFLYEGDSPLAERRAAALSLDATLLAELLGQAELRDLLDPAALAEVEAELACLVPAWHARDAEGAADLLRRLGDLSTAEAAQRGVTLEWLTELETARRAIRVRIAATERWVAIEDAGRVLDALGVPLPVGVPEAFLAPVADPLGDLVSRYARTHGPFQARDVAARFGLGVAVVHGALARLGAVGRVVSGEFRPGGSDVEWCDADVLRRLRRRSLARLRAEVEAVSPETLGRFLPAWQGVGAGVRSTEGLLRVIEQLAGARIPASALETLVLPARVPNYSPGLLDELCTAGEVVWCGAGALPGGDGWVSLVPTEHAHLVLPAPADPPDGEPYRGLLAALDGGVAPFFRAIAAGWDQESTPLTEAKLADALWELVWAGWVTNDTLAPLRAVLGAGGAHRPSRSRVAPRPRPGRYGGLPATAARVGASTPRTGGRWSLTPHREMDGTRRAHALAEVLLDRYGVLTRGCVHAEDVAGGFAAIYPILRAAEDAGRCRRGYFVEGLGAAQFAAGGAVDRLRLLTGPAATSAPAAAVLLAAADPANPYGAALPWPARPTDSLAPLGHRPGRKAGALVVLVEGALVLYVERGGRSLLSWAAEPEALAAAATALADAVKAGWLGKLSVERADGAGVHGTPFSAVLAQAGFRVTPRGLRLRL